ncbi:LysR family transcriptional regulator ArgP [Oerskovia flava]|uniref:LysR family transcriptional regulator ArgP n=1 Tax=Oerskovia flava TaxID=2986422 RepID=UPI002AD4EDE4|nr:LysR family transcriptional regulator ArgP [Oerskovia sp. JB1-3-2]
MDLQPDQLRALVAVADTGTFDAAARTLGVTPSAISQRMRALESAVGQVLVRRGRPATLTPPGQVLVGHARRIVLQQAEVLADLGLPGDGDDGTDGAVGPELTLVITADALTTWALPVLAEAAGTAQLEILREDQDHSIALLRDGTAVAAITSVADPVPGCRATPLGRMRYRPMASPAFAARWFPDGPTPAALAAAPVLVFDRKDDLQDRYLAHRAREGTAPPRHHVPASHEFLRAVELGMGWGMLPDLQSADGERTGRLVAFDGTGHLDVPQYWQQWRLHSPTLDRIATAVRDAAASDLR